MAKNKKQRTERVSLALTPEEKQRVKEAADKDNRPYSQYARLAVMNKARSDLKRKPQTA